MAYDQCQDYKAFQRADLAADYETVGNYNLFMICETPNENAFRTLPKNFTFRLCRHDELETWKRIIVEEPYIAYVTDFFAKVYAHKADEFFRRCTFVCNADGKPVASCFLWQAYEQINTVGWFRVLPEYEGKGLGRALLGEILKTAEYPVYLHTQPTSACAIKLYSDFGFKLITNPVIGHRQNNWRESLPYLKKVMPENAYERLGFTEVPEDLHALVLSAEANEF